MSDIPDETCCEDYADGYAEGLRDMAKALEHAEYQRDAWQRIAQTRQMTAERLAVEKRTAVSNAEYYRRKAGL